MCNQDNIKYIYPLKWNFYTIDWLEHIGKPRQGNNDLCIIYIFHFSIFSNKGQVNSFHSFLLLSDNSFIGNLYTF